MKLTVEDTDASPSRDVPATALELSVVVPTFNERECVAPLVSALRAALAGRRFEIIFVDDDSPDGTADAVREIALTDPRVRCLQRLGRRGLSGACVEGAMAASAPVIAVIDGDMQHDETLLPTMLERLAEAELDLVVGSRYVGGGGVGEWSERRARASRLATVLAQRFTGVRLTDPMSGFFMARADVFRRVAPGLSPTGFKILLDLLTSADRPLRVEEVPYEFRTRAAGESKLDARVMLEFVELLLDKTLGRFLPTKFVMFAMVGSLGVGVHFATLGLVFGLTQAGFATAQAAATLVALTSNFALNNVFTHHDRRLTGWRWLTGWVTFALASSVGAVANVGVATYLFETGQAIWQISALAGIVMSVVWNYVVTSFYTWGRR